jgi:hypothetical protein
MPQGNLNSGKNYYSFAQKCVILFKGPSFGYRLKQPDPGKQNRFFDFAV